MKKGWRLLEASKPGSRFQERYRRRWKNRRGAFHISTVLYVAVGVVLISVSAFFGWLPLLGWGTVILGLGLIAGEFWPAARLMDWLEVRSRRLFRPVGRAFSKLPPWAQLAVSACIALATFALVYVVYRSAFGG